MADGIAAASGTFKIGGELEVNRLGFGAMQLTGHGVWGEPSDPDECVRVLKRSVELGINLIDTADSYGPVVSERLIKQALHPYPADLTIATKVGLTRQGPDVWTPVGRPAYLRQQCELSLRNLGLDCIPLYQLHRIDPKEPLEDQIGELKNLQSEGKIRFIGLSEVGVEEIKAVEKLAPVATVQNLYNVADRKYEDVLDYCEAHGIGFIPWFPLATGALAQPGGPLAALAQSSGHSPSQLALAWLLKRSPVVLPIPGTSKVAHLEDNTAAAEIVLSDADYEALAAAVA